MMRAKPEMSLPGLQPAADQAYAAGCPSLDRSVSSFSSMAQRKVDGRGLRDAAGAVRLLEDNAFLPKDITIFIPCLNEGAAIFDTLRTISEAAQRQTVDYEIHVFDDGSSDNSVAEIERFMAAYPEVDLLLICNDRRHGLAENCFDSALLARGRYHRMGWGDGVDSVDNYVELFRNLDGAQMLIACYDVVHGKSLPRRLLSGAFGWLVRTISGHQLRYFNGGSCIRTVLLRRYHIESGGFGFQADLLTRLLDNGATYKELSLVSTERVSGSSKALSLRNWMSAAWMLMRLVVRRLKRMLHW